VPRLACMVIVTVMSRQSCGSCARVIAQIEPLVRERNAAFEVEDVDSSDDLAMEFGDRVPVILVNEEEIACWEIDDDELIEAIEGAERE
jgi:glutaredoxin